MGCGCSNYTYIYWGTTWSPQRKIQIVVWLRRPLNIYYIIVIHRYYNILMQSGQYLNNLAVGEPPSLGAAQDYLIL